MPFVRRYTEMRKKGEKPMYVVNVPKVRGKMGELGYNITTLAPKLGIDRNTLSSYLIRPDKIPYRVLESMMAILCSTKTEAADIFLPRTYAMRKNIYVERNILSKRSFPLNTNERSTEVSPAFAGSWELAKLPDAAVQKPQKSDR